MVTGFGQVNIDVNITSGKSNPLVWSEDKGVVSVKLTRLDDYLQKPVTQKDRKRIRDQLINNIKRRGSGNGMPRIPKMFGVTPDRRASPPYHVYPSVTHGELETLSYVEPRGRNAIAIGSRSQHASILEIGRKAIVRTLSGTNRRKKLGAADSMSMGKERFDGMVFKGYYPNRRILEAIFRARMPKRLSKNKRILEARAGREMQNETDIENLTMMYGEHAFNKSKAERGKIMTSKEIDEDIVRMTTDIKGTHKFSLNKKRVVSASSMLKEARKMSPFFKDPDRYAAILGIKPHSNIYKDAKGIPYKYGIFTVLTKKVRAVEPYGVFSQTARWAKTEIIKKMKSRIVKIETVEIN